MVRARGARTRWKGGTVKEIALALARAHQNPAQGLSALREYLQACALRSLHESEAFMCLSFVGGTALRFLFNLPRFSEDLDFSLENPDGYKPAKWMAKIERDLSLAGFELSLSWNDRKTVNTAWLRVAGILKEAGISDIAEQKLSIKLEVDTRPPAGAITERQLVNRHVMFSVQHHDLASLMAGKIHALLTRKYTKGRDWYDLVWYRARRPPVSPNLLLLQHALDQTEGTGVCRAEEWTQLVLEQLESSDTGAIARDALPFLERPQDAAFLSIENLRSVFRK